MSKDQTTQPTPRMRIEVDKSPAPIWVGVKFKCRKCTGVFQLEAADCCQPQGSKDLYFSPRCPTLGCGHVSLLKIPEKRGKKRD